MSSTPLIPQAWSGEKASKPAVLGDPREPRCWVLHKPKNFSPEKAELEAEDLISN